MGYARSFWFHPVAWIACEWKEVLPKLRLIWKKLIIHVGLKLKLRNWIESSQIIALLSVTCYTWLLKIELLDKLCIKRRHLEQNYSNIKNLSRSVISPQFGPDALFVILQDPLFPERNTSVLYRDAIHLAYFLESKLIYFRASRKLSYLRGGQK